MSKTTTTTKTTTTALPEKAILAFATIDEKIKALYEKKDTVVKAAIKKYGATSGVVKVKDNEKPFLRGTVVDTLEDFKTGTPIFTSSAVSRFRVEISRLKNQPKH